MRKYVPAYIVASSCRPATYQQKRVLHDLSHYVQRSELYQNCTNYPNFKLLQDLSVSAEQLHDADHPGQRFRHSLSRIGLALARLSELR
jgi:hypothetical protein